MRSRVAVRSDVGRRRDANEDVGLTARPTDPRAGVLLCVADGMGGHPAGEDASRIAVDYLQRYPSRALARLDRETEDLEEALLDVLYTLMEEASEAILSVSEEDPSRHGLGSTLVVALLLGDRCHVLHCGDSQAFRLRGDRLDQLTSDHVVVEGGVRYLTLHLGMPEGLSLDHGVFDLEAGDRLLLCSDGLTDMVSPNEVGARLMAAASPEEACATLIEAANEAGGADNITVSLAFLEAGADHRLEAPEIQRSDRLADDQHDAQHPGS